MTYICMCFNGCSLKRGSRSAKYGFPKRLLVATSIVVIIAMCLIPAEGRPVENRRRHHNLELYKNATRKITKKLRNTKRFFDEERRILKETREYRDGMPEWLPTVNFVDIHFHDYRTPRKNSASITEKKFTYLMPKLYKSLKEYEVIFKRLNNVRVVYHDDSFTKYKTDRQKLIKNTLHRLFSTYSEILDNMNAVNVTVPHFDENRMKLDSLEMEVDATQCLKNDYIAFRGYGNLLNNWYSEFRCTRNKKNTKKCQEFETRLDKKRGNRRQKINRANLSLMS